MAQTRALQAQQNFAVQPKPVLAPLVEEARTRAGAGRTFALGERTLGLGAGTLDLSRRRVALEGQRLDLLAQQAGFERRLEPVALGVGALGVGTQVLGAVRTGQATRLAEARAARTEQRGAEQLRLQTEQTAALRQRGGALQLLYKDPTFYLQGP
mgnify:CR=1 FL=1